MAETPARLKAAAEYRAKRIKEGWKRVNVWLSPEASAKVDALKKVAGSADEVHRQAILAWPGPGAPPMVPDVPVKPKAAPKKVTPTASDGVQLGPTPRKPGSMLIEKKRKSR